MNQEREMCFASLCYSELDFSRTPRFLETKGKAWIMNQKSEIRGARETHLIYSIPS